MFFKSELESELSDGGLEGPTAMQASTMLLRCLEAAEPRDEGESESACVEPQNYTESVLECEEFEPYEETAPPAPTCPPLPTRLPITYPPPTPSPTPYPPLPSPSGVRCRLLSITRLL